MHGLLCSLGATRVSQCGAIGGTVSYIDLLKRRLKGAKYLELGVPGCVVFYQPTL